MAPSATTAVHLTEHSIDVTAPPETCFQLVADVSGWPQVFGPTVHVEVPEQSAGEQLLHIWAFADGRVRDWTSRRVLDAAARRVVFRQVVSAPPVASMGGEWRVEAIDGGSRVVLLHDFQAIGDDQDAVALIEQVVDRNSKAELAALKAAAEQGGERSALRLEFSDSERIQGSPEDVFDFLGRADLWPQRLPHVARLELSEDIPGVQHMEMDTRSPDGSLHTTSSVRVCFADRHQIVYKQLKLPPVMSSHTGRWVIEPDGEGIIATSWHTVTLDPDGVRQALGPDADLADARGKVRHALGTNSSTTLRHAKEYAEARRG